MAGCTATPLEEPMVTCHIDADSYMLMVDIRATYSTLCHPSFPLSCDSVTVTGYSGRAQKQLFTKALAVVCNGQSLYQQFLFASDCPVNLMGRDLLTKLRFNILCTPDGLQLQTPSEPVPASARIFYLAPSEGSPEEGPTTIFWLRLTSTELDTPQVQRLYLAWKTLLNTLMPYRPPADPLHCTFNYLTREDEVYEDGLKERMFDNDCVKIANIYAGPEGVAACVVHTPQQQQWYALGGKSVPHITLTIGGGKEARSL